MRSAQRCRSASRSRSWSRSPIRSATFARYARTHGPFTSSAVAERLGVGHRGRAAHAAAPRGAGTPVEGLLPPSSTGGGTVARRPNGATPRCCGGLRMRSLAAIRGSVEPVSPEAFARFLPVWRHIARPLDGIDGVAAVIEQLAGVPIPASAWESLVLPARVSDYSPAMLDELTATGEVIWSGHGSLPGRDGWIALHPADTAPAHAAAARGGDHPRHARGAGSLAALAKGRRVLRRAAPKLADAENEASVVEALWHLTWAGRVTNDTFAPVRTLLGGGSQAHRTARKAPRSRMYRGASRRARRALRRGRPRSADAGRCCPRQNPTPTLRATAAASLLLDRYGVVTRGVGAGRGRARRLRPGLPRAGRLRAGRVTAAAAT